MVKVILEGRNARLKIHLSDINKLNPNIKINIMLQFTSFRFKLDTSLPQFLDSSIR